MRGQNWEFLWLKWERIGAVERLSFADLTIYRRAGSLVELFGIHWMEK